MRQQFGMLDLFRFTTYIALALAIWNQGFPHSALILFGLFFGFETGRRSEYPTIVMMIIGVLTTYVSAAAFGLTTFFIWLADKEPVFSVRGVAEVFLPAIALGFLTWPPALFMIWWMWRSMAANKPPAKPVGFGAKVAWPSANSDSDASQPSH